MPVVDVLLEDVLSDVLLLSDHDDDAEHDSLAEVEESELLLELVLSDQQEVEVTPAAGSATAGAAVGSVAAGAAAGSVTVGCATGAVS